ncbi:UPF0182 family protein [Natranaerofaba carboxydovora]|uniref:UPF0182 family membrane protein n=1 Tax=Natranaerofaba carboxydovora TaxID=2742683 RepID=UPI001F135E2B|nr:UPF0182 family protein [Natranaerofaba carboxydovora]UMZ74878.1 hypothetical protein ACONDI_02482 [Natranaerofaba carboxydovora]
MHRKHKQIIALGILIFLVLSLDTIANTITNWQWFRAVDYQALFVRPFLFQWLTYIIAFLFGTVFFYLNLNYLTGILLTPQAQVYFVESPLAPYINKLKQIGKVAKIAISAVIGVLWAGFFRDFWLNLIYFIYNEPIGDVDPVFGRDISFYFFELPLYRTILGNVLSLVIFTFLFVMVVYVFRGIVTWGLIKKGGLTKGYSALKHINLFVGMLLLIFALQSYLARFNLLFSDRGAMFGAGYTDLNASAPLYLILTIIGIIGFIITMINFKIGKFKYTALVAGIFVFIFIAGNIYASILQNFIVSPNELSMERPYLENHLEMTRKAYNLHDIDEKMWEGTDALPDVDEDELEQEIDENVENVEENPEDFNEDIDEDIDEDININDIDEGIDEEMLEEEDIVGEVGEVSEVPEIDDELLRNVRLLDYRPLREVYRESQEFRQYYQFDDVDIARYTIDDQYHQVMLSARELDVNRLPDEAQTNINRHLKYTHGYGLAMSPVGEFTARGHPRFFLQDMPVVDNIGIGLERPEIYFGELKNDFVIVNTEEKEFNYPGGGEEVDIDYQGETGIPIDNIINRALYALRERNSFIFLSRQFTDDSEILINRNIQERINTIAPFLTYDDDPYMAVADGRLFWIIDAYVDSDNYPYSNPYDYRGKNYIRNPVKVIVDAYSGEVSYYLVEDEPVTTALSNAFPDLFRDLDEMPEELQDQIRYPVDLFDIQADMLRNYHMTTPVVFYNREDAWDIATEKYYGDTIRMEPYYATLNLPGEDDSEFVLMLPFTPVQRNNMISWLGARNDGENYGELVLYRFPRGTLAYGPRQIDSRIDQDPEISRLFSLWDRGGSSVIRGNLLVIPLENGILYVEPVYLEAEGASFPEMRRVIVAWEDDLIMAPSLEEALEHFGKDIDQIDIEDPDIEDPEDPDLEEELEIPDEMIPEDELEDVYELSRRALELYIDAEDALRDGDWNEYGSIQEELKEVLEKLNEKSEDVAETDLEEN